MSLGERPVVLRTLCKREALLGWWRWSPLLQFPPLMPQASPATSGQVGPGALPPRRAREKRPASLRVNQSSPVIMVSLERFQIMIPLSVLDLSPILEGSDAAESFRNTVDLAQHAERLRYRRYWLAEHHNMPGIASAATAVLIARVAAATSSIRVGAGGIMLPNHAPLVIAEQFGTLESLFPGRIDLGLGRAPGTDQTTARALRRNLASDVDQFPQDVVELMHYFQPAETGQRVHAVPGAGLKVPVWILGSGLFGATLAAELGLPFAFASHFAPSQMMGALATYREHFQPSQQLDRPYAMLGFNVIAAETIEARTVKIATFNINNINKRLENLLAWLAQAAPDVVCLQELKAAQEAFPSDSLRASATRPSGRASVPGMALPSWREIMRRCWSAPACPVTLKIPRRGTSRRP
jgi:luciferase family oxidoreductase group 1